MTERIFSKKCGHCRQRTVELATVPYSVQFDYDGKKYAVDIPALTVPKCKNCGTITLDEVANVAISDAFRRQVGLLTPEQIRKGREHLGLTQREMAKLIRVSEGALSRWETGAQIQQRSLDLLLRLFLGSAWVQNVVADDAVVRRLGTNPDADRARVASASGTISGAAGRPMVVSAGGTTSAPTLELGASAVLMHKDHVSSRS